MCLEVLSCPLACSELYWDTPICWSCWILLACANLHSHFGYLPFVEALCGTWIQPFRLPRFIAPSCLIFRVMSPRERNQRGIRGPRRQNQWTSQWPSYRLVRKSGMQVVMEAWWPSQIWAPVPEKYQRRRFCCWARCCLAASGLPLKFRFLIIRLLRWKKSLRKLARSKRRGLVPLTSPTLASASQRRQKAGLYLGLMFGRLESSLPSTRSRWSSKTLSGSRYLGMKCLWYLEQSTALLCEARRRDEHCEHGSGKGHYWGSSLHQVQNNGCPASILPETQTERADWEFLNCPPHGLHSFTAYGRLSSVARNLLNQWQLQPGREKLWMKMDLRKNHVWILANFSKRSRHLMGPGWNRRWIDFSWRGSGIIGCLRLSGNSISRSANPLNATMMEKKKLKKKSLKKMKKLMENGGHRASFTAFARPWQPPWSPVA